MIDIKNLISKIFRRKVAKQAMVTMTLKKMVKLSKKGKISLYHANPQTLDASLYNELSIPFLVVVQDDSFEIDIANGSLKKWFAEYKI